MNIIVPFFGILAMTPETGRCHDILIIALIIKVIKDVLITLLAPCRVPEGFAGRLANRALRLFASSHCLPMTIKKQ